MNADPTRARGPEAKATERRRPYLAAAAVTVLGLVAILVALVPAAIALPAGRGYEKVSPNDKDGQDILNGLDKAALDGNGAAYISFGAFAGSEGGGLVTEFSSERTDAGWLTESLSPRQVTAPGLASSLWNDFSDDLGTSILSYAAGDPAFDGSTPGTANIYRQDPDTSIHTLTFGQNPPPVGTQTPNAPTYGGASADLSVATYSFNTDPPLPVTGGPDPTPGFVTNAYVSTGNRDVELVSVLPNGTSSPTGGSIGTPSFSPGFNAVSDDGSRIFWSSGDSEVYVRIDRSSTVHASASQRTTPDPNGVQAKTYQYATPDGRFVYFNSGEKLTNNSQAEPGNPDLYRYDVDSGALDDLTTADPDGAGVQGVIGASDAGNRVYFAATGQLAAGATDPGLNLYVLASGQTTFITALDPSFGDTVNWGLDNAKTGRVNPSGSTLLFSSRAPQLGYDNAGFTEFYLYDLSSDEFVCISCRPDGLPATADAAINTPPTGSISLGGMSTYERRNLSTDGTAAFFTSRDPLRPDDTNGQWDAYMWEDGAIQLLSSGQNGSVSSFVDASASGNDAFFLTRERLVGIDTDNSIDLYDGRVGGGLASQNPPPPPPPCQGEECKPPAPPQTDPTQPGSGSTNNPVVPPPPDCSSLDQKAEKKAAKVDKLQKKVGKASGKQKKKLKKKLKQAKKQAKKAQQAADQCNQG